MDSAPLMRLRGVGVTYPGPPELRALHGVDLDVRAGERIVIVGPSGSGKSTLLNVMGLLERPTEGTFHCWGLHVNDLAERELAALRARKFGFVFQAFNLLGDRTIRENIELPMAVQGIPRHERAGRCSSLMELVGLVHRQDGLARHLSGGEKQRVAIARALTAHPDIVLCDEPTGNLDSASSESILALLSDLNREGRTVILVTHEARWSAWGDRVIHVRDGRIDQPSQGA